MNSLLRSLIRQVLLESDETYTPVAPHYAPLGKYAFANVRTRSPRPPPEEDTKTEEAILEELHMHFRDNVPLSKKTTDQILGFINRGLYSDIFKAPPPGTLYRGLSIKDRSFVEKLLQKDDAIDAIILQTAKRATDFASFKTQFDLTNKDEQYVASWTKSLGQAKDFANASGARFQVILCATVEDNPGKWIDCEGFYGLRDIDEYEEESEVIAVGTIRISEVRVRAPLGLMKLYELEQLEKLPKDQRVINGQLNLSHMPITSLPEGLVVNGDLYLLYTDITSLPAGLKVGKDLYLSDTRITSLPADLKVGGILSLINARITSLPTGLEVGGSLDLRDSDIASLPADLQVGGSLWLNGTGITSLPADLQVGDKIFGLDIKYWADVPQRLKGKLK